MNKILVIVLCIFMIVNIIFGTVLFNRVLVLEDRILVTQEAVFIQIEDIENHTTAISILAERQQQIVDYIVNNVVTFDRLKEILEETFNSDL